MTAHIQVLVPESFLEEFHSAVSSLEGDTLLPFIIEHSDILVTPETCDQSDERT